MKGLFSIRSHVVVHTDCRCHSSSDACMCVFVCVCGYFF
jgi:hypothetical protein